MFKEAQIILHASNEWQTLAIMQNEANAGVSQLQGVITSNLNNSQDSFYQSLYAQIQAGTAGTGIDYIRTTPNITQTNLIS